LAQNETEVFLTISPTPDSVITIKSLNLSVSERLNYLPYLYIIGG
jgi:hypothetical protein